MKVYEMDMCSGSLWRKIWTFSVPLMFSNVLQVVFNLSDIAVVGKFAGSIELGAVGSTSILITLYTGLLIGLSGGVNALTALYVGAKNDRDVSETVHTSAIICLAAGVLLALFGILSADFILTLMGTKDELIAGALLYLRVYLLGMPALALFNFGNAVLSAIGDTRRPLLYLSVAGVVNIILNLFFVIVCSLGVLGVALASIISQYLSAVLILRILLRSNENYALRLSELHLDGDKCGQILRIGLPSAFQNALFAFANLFVQSAVNSFGHVRVEGNSAAANADNLVYDMMAAFYTACTSFIGQNRGAGSRERVLHSYYVSLVYSFVMGLLLGGTIYIFRIPFLSIFTNDAEVVEAGISRISIMALSYCVSAFMDCTMAASRGLGRTIAPTVIVIMGSVVFRIIWIYTVFAYFHTIESLYLLYVCSWTLTAVAQIIYFIHIYQGKKTGIAN